MALASKFGTLRPLQVIVKQYFIFFSHKQNDSAFEYV